MNIVIIDIETTSLHPSPNNGVVHIGAVEINPDLMDTTGDAYQAICKPVNDETLIEDAWIFTQGNLTIDEVMKAPDHSQVAEEFRNWLNERKWTAYNLAFEELFLCYKPWNIPHSDLGCIMLAATPICKIPYSYYSFEYDDYIDDFKWPKLKEAWNHIIGEPYPQVWHSALQDADAAGRILLQLIKDGYYKIA